MTGNIVTSEVDAFMYVVLSQAKSICLIGNHSVFSEILLYVYHENILLSSGLQVRNFCREQDMLPADFGKISQ
jgi:hypothetical protein